MTEPGGTQIGIPVASERIAVIERLRDLLVRGTKLHEGRYLSAQGQTKRLLEWTREVRGELRCIYGNDKSQLSHFPILQGVMQKDAAREILGAQISHLRRFVERLEPLLESTRTPLLGKRIFIGHGRSPLWRELKDLINERLGLPWDEFNREAVAGITTSERLQTMLSEAAFAFLIMTGEEELSDATLHARSNVIHEVGLFQGRLGLRRVAVMLEEECAAFSNIEGLSQIRFPRGDISARFEEVRRVMEREGLL